MRIPATIALVLTSLPVLMGAGVYRWVDANGVVNYTQQQPPGVSAEHIEADSGRRLDTTATPAEPAAEGAAAADTAPAAQPPNDRLNEAQREALTGLETAEQVRRDELANLRKANCDRAQGTLDRLSSSGRIRIRDEGGAPDRAMTEEERQERIGKAQHAVVENCIAS